MEKPIGSELIGQQFDDPKYFWRRLSATGDFPYNAFNADTLTGSSGSNYGPLNPALIDMRRGAYRCAQSRGSGQHASDPCGPGHGFRQWAGSTHQRGRRTISGPPGRSSRAGLSEDAVKILVDKYAEGRQFFILGEPHVNVLRLNLALDGLK